MTWWTILEDEGWVCEDSHDGISRYVKGNKCRAYRDATGTIISEWER